MNDLRPGCTLVPEPAARSRSRASFLLSHGCLCSPIPTPPPPATPEDGVGRLLPPHAGREGTEDRQDPEAVPVPVVPALGPSPAEEGSAVAERWGGKLLPPKPDADAAGSGGAARPVSPVSLPSNLGPHALSLSPLLPGSNLVCSGRLSRRLEEALNNTLSSLDLPSSPVRRGHERSKSSAKRSDLETGCSSVDGS